MKNKRYYSHYYRGRKKYFDDPYIRKAHEIGVRSRSWFKLDEIQKQEKLLKPNMTVMDLGSSPGGWAQYAIKQVGSKGNVIGCDILSIDPISGVEFIQGDLRDHNVRKTLLETISNKNVNVVMSDMSPNLSGFSTADHPRSMDLAEIALQLCREILIVTGSFLVKVFHGESLDLYLQKISEKFDKLKIIKPESSRKNSREVYIIATGYKKYR
ncbi:MAG: 23S rRNA (uridine(2552)-2'-O)-methyltransferase RlmE [Candidatus Dasytiphilus stammeri]